VKTRPCLIFAALFLIPNILYALSCQDLDGAYVYAQDNSYLGFFGNNTAEESINNLLGFYGTSYSLHSVRNSSSRYGSLTSHISALNDSATIPPIIFKNTLEIAYLTTNQQLVDGVSLSEIDKSCKFISTEPDAAEIVAGAAEEIYYGEVANLTGLNASDGSSPNSVLLTWDASLGATSYEVFSAVTLNDPYTFVGHATSNSYTVTDVVAGTVYYYFVFPINEFTEGLGQWTTGYAEDPLAAGNLSPVISISSGHRTIADSDNFSGEFVEFNGTATDSDGTIVSTEWLVDSVVVSTELTTTLALRPGITIVTFRATDNSGLARSISVIVDVEVPESARAWPSAYNGVIPNPNLGLELNNIGVYSPSDQLVYTCLKIVTNGQTVPFEGGNSFDISFHIISVSEGGIKFDKHRPFNVNNAVNENGELPACSGQLETTTGIYQDTIKLGSQTYSATFQLVDPNEMRFIMLSSTSL
jgi:hypothetical protein